MRKAAGIMLIVSGIVGVIGLVMSVTDLYVELLHHIPIILWRIASAALLVSGGIFCIRRRYWRACLATAAVGVFIGLSSTIDFLRHIAAIRAGSVYIGWIIPMGWGSWIVLLAGVIATIFIIRRKKEWSEISDSVGDKVSYDG